MEKFNVITDANNLENTLPFNLFIEERKKLKPQIKLLHIYHFDKDLKTLEQNNLSLYNIGLGDFRLTEGYQLIVPVRSRIGEFNNIRDIKLKTYIIYLSYLYGINFFPIYFLYPNYFYELILNLKINDEIKQDLFNLLNEKNAKYFSEYIESFNHAEARDNLTQDSLKLRRTLYLEEQLYKV
jgi:hypothetical protein